MNNAEKFPKTIHGYDMFFDGINSIQINRIATSAQGRAQTDDKTKTVTCRFSTPVVANSMNELMIILSCVRTAGEAIAKDHNGRYVGGELYTTTDGASSSALERIFS